jgi:hypothetical protein
MYGRIRELARRKFLWRIVSLHKRSKVFAGCCICEPGSRELVAEKAPIPIGTMRRWADDLDGIAVRLERKSRYAEKGLLIEHETEW